MRENRTQCNQSASTEQFNWLVKFPEMEITKVDLHNVLWCCQMYIQYCNEQLYFNQNYLNLGMIML